MVPRQTLGHDSKDGVVAADAGAVLLIVLLGVTDLEELRLQEEQREGENEQEKRKPVSKGEGLSSSSSPSANHWVTLRQKFVSLLKIPSAVPSTGKHQIYSVPLIGIKYLLA